MEKEEKNKQTSLGIFIASLADNERELVLSYLENQTYESLSEKFDQLLKDKS